MAAAVTVASCRTTQPTPDRIATPAARPAPRPDPAPPREGPDEEVAKEQTLTTLTEVLPDDTFLTVIGDDLFRILDELGRTELIRRFPSQYEKLVAEMEENLGADLSTAEGFAAWGFDPHGPAGWALIWPEREVFGFLFTVTSRSKLRRSVHRWRNLEVEPMVVGSTLVLLAAQDNDLAVIVEGNTALVLIVEGGEAAADVAHELAIIDTGRSLPMSPRFRATFAGVPLDRDGLLYVNPAGTAERIGHGLVPVVPEINGLGCALELLPNAVECDLRLSLVEDSALRRIAGEARHSPAGGPPIVRWLEREPLFVLHANLDPDVTTGELRAALGPMWSVLSNQLDLDVDGTLVPLSDGSIGMSLGLRDRPPGRGATTTDLETPLATIFIGLRDVAGARRFLGQLTTPAGGRRLTRSGRDFKGPHQTRGPFVGIRGQTLVVTNDQRELQSMGDPTRATGAWRWPTPGEDAPLLLGFNPGGLVFNRTARVVGPVGIARSVSATPSPPPGTRPVESTAVRNKKREIEALEAKLSVLDTDYYAAAGRRDRELANKLGGLWLSLDEAPVGLAGKAVFQVHAPTFGQSFVELVEIGQAADTARDRYWEQEQTLRAQLVEKNQELDEIREREAAVSGSVP